MNLPDWMVAWAWLTALFGSVVQLFSYPILGVPLFVYPLAVFVLTNVINFIYGRR